jgi:hypothetical protein
MPLDNQRKPDKLIINFKGSNKLSKSKSLTGSTKNFRKERMNSQSSKVVNGDISKAPQKWSSHPSVVYSNPKDSSQYKRWNNKQRSSLQNPKTPSQQGSPHSSVVYSKFQDSPQPPNRNENNQQLGLDSPQQQKRKANNQQIAWDNTQQQNRRRNNQQSAWDSPQQQIRKGNNQQVAWDSPQQQNKKGNNQQSTWNSPQQQNRKGNNQQSAWDIPQQQNLNENNQGRGWKKSWNAPNQRFNEKSGRNSGFIYTTSAPPPFYPNPSPSMFTSSSRRGSFQQDSQTNTRKFSQGTAEIGQNPSGWNDFKTPVQDTKSSMMYSKPRDSSFRDLQANKISPSEITIAPNFLYNQEQTSQYPRPVSQQQGYSKPQNNPGDIAYNRREMPKLAAWPPAPTSPQTQTVGPTTYRYEFSRQDSFATKTPNGWSNPDAMNRNQDMYGTTTPSLILQQGNNQEIQYQNTQQGQNTNSIDYQYPNRRNEIQQQQPLQQQRRQQQQQQSLPPQQPPPQQLDPFKQPQLKQGFQPQQQYYPDFQKETNQQQQTIFPTQEYNRQNSFQNQQQKPPQTQNRSINQQNENASPIKNQQSNQQQSEVFGRQKKTFSNQQFQQTSQNENFSQQRQSSFQNRQQFGNINNQYETSPPIQQGIEKIGVKQNQSLSSNQQNKRIDNSFQNQPQQTLKQNENFGQKEFIPKQNGPVFQQGQNALPNEQQQNQPQNRKMGEQQQRFFRNQQNQRQDYFSNQQQQQPNQQQTELMNPQPQNSFGRKRQQQVNVQKNTQNTFKNQQQPPMFQQQQQRKNTFNPNQQRQSTQQQRFQQQNKQQRSRQTPGNNARGLAPNQGPSKRRRAKKIPAPAYVSNITSI